ncbi:MAG TPA: ROK family protein [Kiritimatiellia bacterium]|jgi:glucokinase|nr:ROK family protein [Kiritimatiellia bacterium]HRU69898.1 ROK family protein [Kiritimatiellia bacterium]
MLIGAIDGGGTKVLTAVMKTDGTIVARRQETVPTADIPAYFRRCAGMLAACAQEAGVTLHALEGVGMNIPGMVTPDGYVLGSPSAGWGAFQARPLLADALALSGGCLFFENDINACALAERRFGGAGDNFIWLTISTGNGGAVVANGRLVRGNDGCAGEIGHLKVERDAPYPCGCGGRGCLEAHASGVAIARRAVEAGLPAGTDAKRCEELARCGNTTARAVYAQTGTYIGRALAMAANLLNPAQAFIGGGASKALDLMLPGIQQTLHQEAIPQCRSLRVTQTSLGYEAALLGAASVCLDGLNKSGADA